MIIRLSNSSIFYSTLFKLVFLCLFSVGLAQGKAVEKTPLNTLPSEMLLLDYEQVLYPWLWQRGYASLGWVVDSQVRDTGPFIQGENYGVHPAVRIYYSPEVVKWIKADRQGSLPDGSIIIKEMLQAPAAIYKKIQQSPYFQDNTYYEDFLATLMKNKDIGSWTVMIKDRGGNSKDGWFWAGPGGKGEKGNYDNFEHVLTSGFGLGTCIRCHASASSESTFVASENFEEDEIPLQFRVDNSWRSKDYLKVIIEELGKVGIPEQELESLLSELDLPPGQKPWVVLASTKSNANEDKSSDDDEESSDHKPHDDMVQDDKTDSRLNLDFVHSFGKWDNPADIISFPQEYADRVYPSENPQEYITSSNCYGCHGGLGGKPSGVSMFVKNGPGYGDGYNISPYGEWRWSPMGLAGRDPIFHAQLESEMIILLKENGQLDKGKQGTEEVVTTQQAVVDTCLRCHGAMGLRQKGLDENKDAADAILNPHFDPNLFYIREPLTAAEKKNYPFKAPPNQSAPHMELNYDDYQYGNLAREGISCTICHRIAPASPEVVNDWIADTRDKHPKWLGDRDDVVWSDAFFYFMGKNNTGIYERAASDEILGPFDDIVEKPMEHAMGIKPILAPSMKEGDEPFIRDSAMCGTCHTINLPNIGLSKNKDPVLTALEPNENFQQLNHSIEQATYLEWLNSKYGPGKENKRTDSFKSCQDCHMPNRFALPNREAEANPGEIEPVATQIATIQDSTYPAVEHQLATEEIFVPVRADYRRHEFAGLNAFLIEMFAQFPEILGVNDHDYETSAKNGAQLSIDNMLLSVEEKRVATVEIGSVEIQGDDLVVDAKVTNKTGHKFPSGVSFRRVWIELLVMDEQDQVLWGSGRTNKAGVIVDGDGKILDTEFLTDRKKYQHHYQTISRQDQVQIYEELITNKSDEFTTSFIHRVKHVKDNRLLPEGWVPGKEFAGQTKDAGIGDQGELLKEFMEATDPEGIAKKEDQDYMQSPGDGADRISYRIPADKIPGATQVQATVYSQAFMPAWFYQRFALAARAKENGYDTPAADRLFYLTSRLELEDTPLASWKIKVDSTTEQISGLKH